MRGDEPTIGVLDPTTPAEALGERKAEIQRGEYVGRYVIVRLIGRGGMGSVYAAHDPQLDRQIAIKLLHSSHEPMAAERMIQEAQALARLEDPHVVSIYDAGDHDGQVFIAMQLIDGEDLATALRRRPSSAQILTWFVAAGRGLAAAHAAGLVHRDFKPNNVLMDRHGRVAVTDFGLVRDLHEAHGQGRAKTALGAIMGTPAYMSPEQHSNQPATEASDQFSFCVSAWEALFGQHPYVSGDRGAMSPFAIGYQIFDGALIPPPRGTRVPRRAIDALARGLTRDPATRWPSMTELLAELAPAPRKRARWPIAVGVAVVAGGAGAAAMYFAGGRTGPNACVAAAGDRLHAAWPAGAGQHVHDGFMKTGRSYADAAARATRTTVDHYAERWLQLASDVCSAEQATSGPPTELVQRRRACLDARLDVLRGLTAVVTGDVTPDLVDHAQQVADGLPDLGDCIDADALMAAPGVPPPAKAAAVSEIEVALGTGAMHGFAGDLQRSRTELAKVAADADALGWPPLAARAHLALGRTLFIMLEPSRGELMRAAELAVENRLDRDAARAFAFAVQAAGTERANDALTTLAPLATASAARTGDHRLVLGAEIANARALVRAHRWQDGLRACKQALADAEHGDTSPADFGLARDCMVEALVPLSAYTELEPLLQGLIADKTTQFGPDHPSIADYIEVRVSIDIRRGELVEARKNAEHALEIRRKAYPAGHFKIAMSLHTLGEVAEAEGKDDEARDLFEQSLAMTDPSRPEQVINYVALQVALGMSEAGERGKEHHVAAIGHLEKAIDLLRHQNGGGSTELAVLLLNYGQVKSEDNVEAALGILGEARAILERNHDKRAAAAGIASAIVAFNDKRFAQARQLCEDALPHLDVTSEPGQVATAKRVLAKAMAETHGDRAAYRKIATEARELFAKLGPGAEGQVKDLDKWLAKH